MEQLTELLKSLPNESTNFVLLIGLILASVVWLFGKVLVNTAKIIFVIAVIGLTFKYFSGNINVNLDRFIGTINQEGFSVYAFKDLLESFLPSGGSSAPQE